MRVLLLGLMGAGKTTVGRTLAHRLRWAYFDNDDLVAELAGTSRANLARSKGTRALRVAEAQALRAALARPGPLVAGIAAGIVLDPDDAAPLRSVPPDVAIVWLRARIETLADRLRNDPADRPWLTGDLEQSLRDMAALREPSFHELAHVVVDVDAKDPEQTADEIIKRLSLSAPDRSEHG